jgi:hypothetical protein
LNSVELSSLDLKNLGVKFTTISDPGGSFTEAFTKKKKTKRDKKE